MESMSLIKYLRIYYGKYVINKIFKNILWGKYK